MERLRIDEVIEHCKRHTERMESHSGRRQLEETPVGNSDIMKQYWEHRQVAGWLEELKAYKDAEKQRLLLRFPCKVGDVVYFPKYDYHDSAVITKIEIEQDGITFYWAQYEVGVDCTELWDDGCFSIDEIGKTVFLTKEEAEQALAEMKEV